MKILRYPIPEGRALTLVIQKIRKGHVVLPGVWGNAAVTWGVAQGDPIFDGESKRWRILCLRPDGVEVALQGKAGTYVRVIAPAKPIEIDAA